MEENELYDRIGESDLNPNYKDGQVYQHEDVNNMLSILKTAINANYYDIQKLENGETNVGSAGSVDGATVSRYLDEELQADDNKVPSSQQAKAYMDNLFAEYSAPVRGVDYWTDEDKEEIIDDTSEAVLENINGKNLFDGLLELGNYSNSTGLKFDADNLYRNTNPIPVKPNTTYTFSINGVSQKYCTYYYGNNGTFITCDTSLTTGTFTTPANCYYVNFRCFGRDFTSDFANLKIQLELGDTATAYEPYRKLIKEENGYVKENAIFYASDFKCRNMFDKSIYITGKYYNDTTGEISNAGSANNYLQELYIPVQPNTQYTATADSGSTYIRIVEYDANKNYIKTNSSSTSNTISITTTSTTKYVRLSMAGANVLDTLQFEVGEATPYTEYKNFDNTPYIAWTNPNTGVAFDPQDVNISNLSNYKYYEIIYKLHATQSDYYQTSGKIPTGLSTCIGGGYARANNTPRFWSRYVTYADTKLTFTTGYYSLNFTDNASTANDILVPYQIILYK